MKKGIIFSIAVVAIFYVWWQIFIPVQNTKKEKITSQPIIQTHEEYSATAEKFNKKYQVLYGMDENLSLRGTTRFSRKILVNLGLSEKELTDNLIHAAWEMQKEKNATAIMIFAYRIDDTQRDLYTAGRCCLAPSGKWAEAYSTKSNLLPIVETAEIYFRHIPPMYRIKSNATINENNTCLYKNEDFEDGNIIARLKKGTKAIVVGSKRFFSIDDFMDIYEIQFSVRGGKNVVGWVRGDKLDTFQPEMTVAQPAPEKNMTQYLKERYKTIYLHDKKISDWKKAKREDKIIICEVFILIALSTDKLKITVISMENVTDYAKILADTVDAVVSNSRNFDYINVIEMIMNIAKSIGWI